MTRWIFDYEATGAQRNHAHPYDYRNVACNVGFKNIDTGEVKIWKIEYDCFYGCLTRKSELWLGCCQ